MCVCGVCVVGIRPVPSMLFCYSFHLYVSRLLADFKDQVVISNVNGKPDVITFLSTASKILQDFNDNREIEQDITKKDENYHSCI